MARDPGCTGNLGTIVLRAASSVALLLLAAGASGCGSAALGRPQDDPALAALAASAAPAPDGVYALGAILVAPLPTGEGAPPRGRDLFPIEPPADACSRDLQEALGAYPVIGEPALVEADPLTREGLVASGAAGGVDFLVIPSITRHEVRYLGRNGWWGLNVAIWMILLVPSFFVPDLLFGLETDLAIEVFDLHRGETVWTGRAVVGVETSLAAVSRGGGFMNFVFGFAAIPGTLSESSWHRIAESLEMDSRAAVRRGYVALITRGLLAASAASPAPSGTAEAAPTALSGESR